MSFIDRILTIVVTATLTSAGWIVFGGTFLPGTVGEDDGTDAGTDTVQEGVNLDRAPAPERTSTGASASADPKAPSPATPPPPVTTALAIPVAGVAAADLTDSFLDPRGDNGIRRHEAIDIMAPIGTPVTAAAPGMIAKIHRSKAGGRSVYVRSLDGEHLHFYAHLDRYADGLKEGAKIERGALLGTVGNSGNASPDAPHLHFAVLETTADAEWWEPANAVNPYPLLTEPTR